MFSFMFRATCYYFYSTSSSIMVQIHCLIPFRQRCHPGTVVDRQLQRPPAPVEQKPYYSSMHFSRDRHSCSCPEIHLLRGLDCDRGPLSIRQRNQPKVAERELPLVHPSISQVDCIVCAPFPFFPLTDRRDTGPQVDHAVTDKNIGSGFFVNCREDSQMRHHEDTVY